MREHLYKAKRVNWRELPKEEWWVEGAVLQSEAETRIATSFFSSGETEEGIMVASYLVDPETVCEYTGLNDKDMRKIFEGDICKDSNNIVRILWNDKHQWVVEISKTESVLSKGLIFPLWQYDNCKENGYRTLEVIGNIFDNPELLQNE